jgi:hypothetical protein
MSIHLQITCSTPAEFDEHLKALGLVRDRTPRTDKPDPVSQDIYERAAASIYKNQETSETIVVDATKPEGAAIIAAAHAEAERVQKALDTPLYPKPTAMDGDRERGKAGPGHRRRTDKQIAEDTAYFASEFKNQPSEGGSAEAPLAPGSEQPLISTGEERISPEDAADEAAETAAHATDKPTLETLRAAVGRYTETFGAKASVANIRAIIGKPMIEVAEEELPAAIARVEAATRGETIAVTTLTETAPIPESVFGDALADKPTEPVHATKADVIEAFAAYGKKYDGVSDPKLMTITREDLPKVLEGVFGAGATTVAKIPQTPEGFGKAMTAVYVAVRDNPFGRTPK